MEQSNPPETDERPHTAKHIAYIALGSNVGDRAGLLRDALSLLDGHPDIAVLRVSAVYETAPVGFTEQPAFLNMAAALGTSLEPFQLLHTMLGMEKQLGRTRDIRWGPRTIDLDLLLYEEVVSTEEELTLPHPRMMERAFVLVPLADVLESGHALYGQATDIAQQALQDRGEGIALWNTINWQGASAHSAS